MTWREFPRGLGRHPGAAPRFAMVFDPGTVLYTTAAGTKITLGGVAAVGSLAGTALSAVTAVSSGNQQKAMSEYNAKVMEREAEQTKAAADLEEQRQRNRTNKLLSTQRAAIGASGLDLEGSPMLLMSDTAAEAELDALLIRHSGSVQTAKARSQAAVDRMSGRAAQSRGYYSGAATLLTGMGSISRLYGPKKETLGGDE